MLASRHQVKLAEDPGFQLRVLPVIYPSVRELKKDIITTVRNKKRRHVETACNDMYLHGRTIQEIPPSDER